jgi:FixJ family two-component response regulator
MLVLEPTDPSLLDLPVHATPVPDGAEELAEVVACARSLTEHDLRLLELLAEGRSPHEVASALQISVRTMRNHRDAVVHRLRVAALAA